MAYCSYKFYEVIDVHSNYVAIQKRNTKILLQDDD